MTTTTTTVAPATSHHSGTSSAGSGVALPPRPARYVPTSIVAGVNVVVRAAIMTGGCCLVDGPVGVGKTTAVVEAARNMSSQAVYVNMFGTDTTRDQMDAIWTAMTGTNAVGTAARIRDDILDTLRRTSMTLLIDDAHHVGFKGLANILSIWNRIHTARGTGTPIVLCGNNLAKHLNQTVPELLSRASTQYVATPLAGKALVDAVLAMEQRIEGTDPATIRDINMRYFKGEIRRWDQFFNLLFIFRGAQPDGPLTGDEAAQVLAMMPRSSR